MHLLICGATRVETEPDLKDFLKDHSTIPYLNRYRHNSSEDIYIDLLVSGVGQVSTALTLAKAFSQTSYDFAINTGVAGSFSSQIKPGSVVLVTRDCFADLGAEDGEEFLTLPEIGLKTYRDDLFNGNWLEPELPELESLKDLIHASGITVNTVHGNSLSIERIKKRISPETESMEGAAFFLAAMDAGVPCIQLRGISNRVEKRQRENWKLTEALEAVNKRTTFVLHELVTRNRR